MSELDKRLDAIVGLPDYGVAFILSPWPDGGWMASATLTDREWVTTQASENRGRRAAILRGLLTLTELEDYHRTIYGVVFDGWGDPPNGFTAHGSNPLEAVRELEAKILAAKTTVARSSSLREPLTTEDK